MKMDSVILVDEQDNAIGLMEKLQAHQKGCLHRAFSIFIVDTCGNMLLQQRAATKYHSAGLWSNACCSHPMYHESLEQAALRRLQEEMGFHCPLSKLFSFIYRSKLENGLIEHELDHIFLGRYEGSISPDPQEVSDFKFWAIDEIESAIALRPDLFTYWFKIALPEVKKHL